MSALRYLPPPSRCEHLRDLAARCGGTVVARPGEAATTAGYALPPHATAELRAFLAAWPAAPTAERWVGRLPGGRVFGAGQVLAPDGASVARDVSHDFGKRFEDHWLLTYRQIRPPTPLAGTVGVVATTLGEGYAHWLLEELPRLLTLPRDDVDTVIAHATPAFCGEAWRSLGFRGRVVEPGRYSHFECETLLVPSFVAAPGHPNAELVQQVTTFAAPLAGAKGAAVAPTGERLYLSRERARRRRVVNDADLWARLEPRGFRRVHLEEMTWAEQIRAFRGAREIVAPHGAGLANLVFCERGTRVVELFHRSYVNPGYWRLATVRGLDYRPLAAAFASAPGGPEEPLACAPAANRYDVRADVEAVLAALR